MKRRMAFQPGLRLWGLMEYEAWLDKLAREHLGMTGAEFEATYDPYTSRSTLANDMAAVLPIMKAIRARDLAAMLALPPDATGTGRKE